jgi:hypothetical protein
MKLIIEGSRAALELESVSGLEWHMSDPAIKRRVGIQHRYGIAGGVASGDMSENVRNLTLKSTVTATNELTVIEKLNSLYAIFSLDNAPFYLVDSNVSRRARIELQGISPTFRDGLERISGEVSIEVVMLDTFWEDANESVLSENLSSGGSLTVNNVGSVRAYPVIEITSANTNNIFSLYNRTVTDVYTIASASIVTGSRLLVDSQNGKSELSLVGTTEISHAIASGTGYLYLERGLNTIEYESNSSSALVTITWRNRYAF